jgi:hypothetical protein
MIETVWELISTDHLWMIDEELQTSRHTICRILVEDLRYNAVKLQACQEIIQSVDDDQSLLDPTVTGYEIWCFQYDTKTKTQPGMVSCFIQRQSVDDDQSSLDPNCNRL